MDKYLKRLMKKANPVAQLLMSPTFRQQTVINKKEYNRKKVKEKDLRDEKDNVQFGNNIVIEYVRMYCNVNG